MGQEGEGLPHLEPLGKILGNPSLALPSSLRDRPGPLSASGLVSCSGPLYLLSFVPGMLFPVLRSQMVLGEDTSPERPSVITLAGAALPFPLLVLSPPVLTVFFAMVRPGSQLLGMQGSWKKGR